MGQIQELFLTILVVIVATLGITMFTVDIFRSPETGVSLGSNETLIMNQVYNLSLNTSKTMQNDTEHFTTLIGGVQANDAASMLFGTINGVWNTILYMFETTKTLTTFMKDFGIIATNVPVLSEIVNYLLPAVIMAFSLIVFFTIASAALKYPL